MRIGIVIGKFHEPLARDMLKAAESEARALGAEVTQVVWVPGSLEAPIAAKRLLKTKKFDALVVLGYIERGETLHGEVMGHAVIQALIGLQLEYMVPMGLGIIGPGATMEQANSRKVGNAQRAVRAAVGMASRKR
jgi:6,7-dimethyl-8-ribityllumazine synthase